MARDAGPRSARCSARPCGWRCCSGWCCGLAVRHAEPLLDLIGVAPGLRHDVQRFLLAISWAAPALTCYFALRGLSEGLSLTRPSMYFQPRRPGAAGAAGLCVDVRQARHPAAGRAWLRRGHGDRAVAGDAGLRGLCAAPSQLPRPGPAGTFRVARAGGASARWCTSVCRWRPDLAGRGRPVRGHGAGDQHHWART